MLPLPSRARREIERRARRAVGLAAGYDWKLENGSVYIRAKGAPAGTRFAKIGTEREIFRG